MMKNLTIKNLMRALAATTFIYVSSVAAADYPEKGDFARGAKAWSENCNRCHNMRGPSELRDDQWITTTFHMRVRGGLTGEEVRDIITFLQTSNNQ